MILPIYAFGQKVLKEETEDIDKDYPNLQELIANMYETMYNAHGIGLAAPQIGLGIRLFLVDTLQIEDDEDDENKKNEKKKGIKKVFINADIVEEAGTPWSYEEGCLSIPDLRAEVSRQPQIRITYFDENFKEHDEVYSGMNARVIQHEYDHVDGVLFIDHLKPLKKRLIKRRLEKIKVGNIDCNYKMKFIPPKK